MTQLGRYAEIRRRRLDACAVVQDSFFSRADAAGKDSRIGAADAVETHVHLESMHDDELARTALDMSEQTCFLHALCRTDLHTAVEIKNLANTADSL